MSERALIGAFMGSREAYNLVHTRLTDGDLSEQGKLLVAHIGEYYDRDAEAQRVDPELLAREVGRSLTNPKHKETFSMLIERIATDQYSPANVVHDFIAVRQEAIGAKLASALAAGNSEKAAELVSEWSEWQGMADLESEVTAEVQNCLSAGDLVRDNFEKGKLIEVWPKSLNDRLDGGCLPGHHIVVFARPEMGKTMFLINSVAGFLKQGLRVLYIGNEDPQADITMRVFNRLTGMSKFEVAEDPDLADMAAFEEGYENLYMVELAPGTPREITAAVEEVKPQVLLIDQLRNINVGEDQFVQKLEKAATFARNLAKKYGLLVISVTQAGDSASNKAVLDMGDVDSSNTGVPAQADVMVGIGATADDINAGRRVISLPKNKRSGNHEFFPVRVDPALNRIGGIAE